MRVGIAEHFRNLFTMNTFVKSLGLIVALTVLLAPSSNGAFPQGKNIKTSAKQLNLWERFLIRKYKPEIPLDDILAQEQATDDYGDDYDGGTEWWNIELPLFLMQLNKLGDEVLFPSWSYQEGFYMCYIGVCFGWNRIESFRKPLLDGVRNASVDGSVNGTQLRLHFQIPDMVGNDPLYTYDDTDYGQSPPETQENDLYENATVFVKNFSILMTATVDLGPNGLEASNLNIEWGMDDLRVRYENGTHTFPDGRQEQFGAKERLLHEEYMEFWYREIDEEEGYPFPTIKALVENNIKVWLNCFLTNGRNGEDICSRYLNEPLHRQSFAELLHAFGLNALNKARNAQQ